MKSFEQDAISSAERIAELEEKLSAEMNFMKRYNQGLELQQVVDNQRIEVLKLG